MTTYQHSLDIGFMILIEELKLAFDAQIEKQQQQQSQSQQSQSQQSQQQFFIPVANILPLVKTQIVNLLDLNQPNNFASSLMDSELLQDYSHAIFFQEASFAK